MKIFTDTILAQLTRNGQMTRAAQAQRKTEPDHRPVIKVFNPAGSGTWLLTELDGDGDTLFGLCDLGMGEPELGNVSKAEMESIRVMAGTLTLERDIHFQATHPLSVYTEASRHECQITESKALLDAVAARKE